MVGSRPAPDHKQRPPNNAPSPPPPPLRRAERKCGTANKDHAVRTEDPEMRRNKRQQILGTRLSGLNGPAIPIPPPPHAGPPLIPPPPGHPLSGVSHPLLAVPSPDFPGPLTSPVSLSSRALMELAAARRKWPTTKLRGYQKPFRPPLLVDLPPETRPLLHSYWSEGLPIT